MNPYDKAKRLGLTLYKSPRQDKKYYIIHPISGRQVHFGAKGMSDYTKHKDPLRRLNYRRRHGAIMMNINGIKKEAYKVKYTPAWLSWHILW